jgi:AcrR family transcriptional regulator
LFRVKSRSKHRTPARERVLAAAYYLFSTQGVGGVGVNMIAVASGCAKASLYTCFKSKQDLALAFLDRRAELGTLNWLEATRNQSGGETTRDLRRLGYLVSRCGLRRLFVNQRAPGVRRE